uniref:ZAD domain-containing protein n=1 Tax=Anopheles atroparvus TaxID=41427 RepID=A0AAG5CRI9_ANOAO
MEGSFRRSLLRQPDSSFESEKPPYKDHTADGLCRLCCSNDSELRELFPGGYKEELLLRKIYNCTTVQISHGEDSDALICSACEGKIEDFFQYREQCRTNDVLHRKWKRQYLERSAPARPSSLVPVVSVKCEPDDSEYFGPHELVPLDTHSDVHADASAIDESFDNSFGQPEHSTMNQGPSEQEDHNLLELMSPEHSFESIGIRNISKYDKKSDDDDNDADFRLHIKQEPEDIDDSYGWTDMEDPDRSYGETSMNSGLIPVIEDTSVINTEVAPKRGSPKEEDSKKALRRDAATTEQDISASSLDAGESGHTMVKRYSNSKSDNVVKHLRFDYKIVKNSKHRTRLHADGHNFVRETTRVDGTVTWRCRKNYDRCRANAEQYRDGTVSVFGRHDHVTVSHTERRRNANGTFAYKFMPSARGNKTLIVGGHRYMKFYTRADRSTLWRCANAPQCKAKASLEDDGKVYIPNADVHNHEKSELPITPKDVEHNQLQVKNSTSNMITDGSIKGEEAADEATTSHKPRASVTVNVPVKCATKGAIVKKRKDADYRIVTNKKGFQALVYKGYRYCKVRVRADGSIKWVCKMNRKTCHAGLFQYPDGRLEWMNSVRHNHMATNVDEVPAAPATEQAVVTKYHIDEETFTSSEWYFVRNKKNGTTLMHAGYRYNKNSVRSDMSSLWRCSRGSVGCRASIVMYPNETISKLDQVDHSHSPPPETDEPIIDDSLLNSEVGNDVDDTVGSGVLLEEEDDPDANMRTLLNFTLGVSADDSVAGSKEVLSRAEAGYRFIQNRRFTKSLLFRGYRYCRHTPRQDGSIQWICLMNKKTCKASVKTLSDGRLVLINIIHNHDRLEEDEEEDDDASASGYISENNNTTLERKPVKGKLVADNSSRTAQDGITNSHGYYYALNRNNRECLIFQQCRYSKSSTRADGSIVWRCMMAGGTCPASAIVHQDGSCISYRDMGHKHPPLSVLPDAVRYPDGDRSPSSSKENVSSPKVIITNSSLLYKQHLWKKTKMHSDGVVAQFECAEATGCQAVVKVRLQQNGDKPRILHETPHNHGGAIEKVCPASRRNSFPGHDGTFQLYKTARGQLTLVYKDYRYSFRSRQTDGTTSWKCRANKRCTARFYISKAGTVLPTEVHHLSHNHEQNGHTMRWAEPIRAKDENFSSFDDLVQQCFCEMQAKQSVQVAKTIKYGGHTYTMRTVKPNGREHWRCALFQTKACRAALFCRNNGKIVEHTNSLPHTHKPIGPRVLPSRSKAASPEKNNTTTVALYRSDAQVGLNAAGSEDFKFVGRNAKTIAFRRHRYNWTNENRDGSTFYRCVHHTTSHCSVMIKLNPSRTRIFAYTNVPHTHDPDIPEKVDAPEVPSLSLTPRKKSLMFMLNAGPALTDFHFERSSRGVTLYHGGYHYWSHNKLSSGWMVYRCRMQKLRCLAAGYYNPRERHFHLRQDVTHNHAAPVPTVQAAGGRKREERTEPQRSIEAENEPQPLVDQAAAGDTESPEETGITTEDYTFLRRRDGKISLSYAGSLYTFAGKRETADGRTCSIYNCFLEQCDASVELLPSGLVHAVEQNHRRHIPHDLQQMEDLGRGSTDFRIVETSAGTAVMTFQGYRYYNNNISRSREDGSSRWYCQSTVGYEKKADGGRFRKRCFVPLMMLPNGRVSSPGKHDHPLGRVVDDPTAYMVVDGHRYQFKRTLPNNSSLWRCVEFPSCSAMVYRLENGKVQTPQPAHCHGNKMKVVPTQRLRILNGTTMAAKVSPPAAAAAAPIKLVVSGTKGGSIAPATIVQSISMAQFEKAHGRRSFWYFGNRYYFYHTRSDGKQYWRCSARTNECKCRAGLLRLSDGTIIPHNNEPHSHPDQMPGQTDPMIPNPPSLAETRAYSSTSVRKIKRKARELEEKVQRKVQLTEQQHLEPSALKEEPEVEEPAAMEGGTFDYKILDQHNSSEILLEQKGIVYTLANKHTGGGRVYCCKNKLCQFEKLLLASGKLISLSHGRHICEENIEATVTTRTSPERVVEQLPSITPRAGDNSFVFPCKTSLEEREIEDPEDFMASDTRMDDDDPILPDAKRLRLTLHPDPMEEHVAARGEDVPDDNGDATDDEQKTVEEEDPSSSAWLDVEQEEIIDSSYDNEEDGRSGSNKASAANHIPPDHDEETEVEGTRTTTPAATTCNAEDTESNKAKVDTHPHSHMTEEDESNDESESHSKGGTKELVVSAEPHESYARKSSDKSVEDAYEFIEELR